MKRAYTHALAAAENTVLLSTLRSAFTKRSPQARDALLAAITHPVYVELQTVLGLPYRVVFTNIDELSALLISLGFARHDDDSDRSFYRWISARTGRAVLVARVVFGSDSIIDLDAIDGPINAVRMTGVIA